MRDGDRKVPRWLGLFLTACDKEDTEKSSSNTDVNTANVSQ